METEANRSEPEQFKRLCLCFPTEGVRAPLRDRFRVRQGNTGKIAGADTGGFEKGVSIIFEAKQGLGNALAVIYADDSGERIKSSSPAAFCQVLFKPVISWVLDSARRAGINRGFVVADTGSERMIPLMPEGFSVVSGDDTERIAADGFEHAVVLRADTPLLSPEDISHSFGHHLAEDNDYTVLTAGESGRAAGALWCKRGFLLKALNNLTGGNTQDGDCLPDIVSYGIVNDYIRGNCAVSENAAGRAFNRKELAALNKTALEKILDIHMENGVDIPFPDGIVIGPDVEIGPDTIILPGTILRGKTVIGSGCEIGPNSYLDNAVVGDNCRILSSFIDSSTVEAGVRIGPMSNLRPDCHIHENVKIGDFVEVKNSTVGAGTSIAHLTYVGDSDVGKKVNFGCGVVTVNYDGKNKHRTTIGDNAFIGCNTNLVAPVKVGDRAYSAAGTTITEDVPEGALVIGRARQTVKEGWLEKSGKHK